MSLLTARKLKREIIEALKKQGYDVRKGVIQATQSSTKDDLRKLNQQAVATRIAKAEPGLRSYEEKLLTHIANGIDVAPDKIQPRLVYVERGSFEELLFRYAALHWSIPVSSGYGRRMRYLVVDEYNDKLIGLFGLGDPVYSIGTRDQWIGWSAESKRQRLYNVMDAYVLGAVPPYAELLCGKLIALLALSNEVRERFARKYTNQETLISREKKTARLALITTTSALGRSSVYNRIKLDGQEFWVSAGFTQGYGDLYFSDGIYDRLVTFAKKNCVPTNRNAAWGEGFRNRREVIKKCLMAVGLSTEHVYHGIQRQVYLAPLGKRVIEFLRGEAKYPCYYDWPADYLSQRFLERWLIPRATRNMSYRDYDRETYRLWPKRGLVC